MNSSVSCSSEWLADTQSNLSSSEGFDPGSERTLAAWIRHASRTRKVSSETEYSGERVSNAWITYLRDGDNFSKGKLIPNNVQVHKFLDQR